MVQVGCTPLFVGWYGIYTILRLSAISCVNPVPTSTLWCNQYIIYIRYLKIKKKLPQYTTLLHIMTT